MKQDLNIPVIAVDGGAGTGKGTTRGMLAKKLDFHELDSGVLYRALGVKAYQLGVKTDEVELLVTIANRLNVRVEGETIFLDGMDQTLIIRSDEMGGTLSSQVAKHMPVRQALEKYQLEMRKMPGLVADGRDMGLMFDTPNRFFIKTAPEVKAKRRVLQFQQQLIPADYDAILAAIILRDKADEEREANPLRPHPKAMIIDNTFMTREEVVDKILRNCKF